MDSSQAITKTHFVGIWLQKHLWTHTQSYI